MPSAQEVPRGRNRCPCPIHVQAPGVESRAGDIVPGDRQGGSGSQLGLRAPILAPGLSGPGHVSLSASVSSFVKREE